MKGENVPGGERHCVGCTKKRLMEVECEVRWMCLKPYKRDEEVRYGSWGGKRMCLIEEVMRVASVGYLCHYLWTYVT